MASSSQEQQQCPCDPSGKKCGGGGNGPFDPLSPAARHRQQPRGSHWPPLWALIGMALCLLTAGGLGGSLATVKVLDVLERRSTRVVWQNRSVMLRARHDDILLVESRPDQQWCRVTTRATGEQYYVDDTGFRVMDRIRRARQVDREAGAWDHNTGVMYLDLCHNNQAPPEAAAVNDNQDGDDNKNKPR